jgi:hypothetical protein
MVRFDYDKLPGCVCKCIRDATAAGDRQAPRPTAGEIVDSPHTHPHTHGYEVVGYATGIKMWLDNETGVMFEEHVKRDVQMSQYDYNGMVLGFR